MRAETATDYETYCEIMDELLRPICAKDLDADTLKRLYESKLVYLESLRVKCFQEMNRRSKAVHFSLDDYSLILKALKQTHQHLRDLVLLAVSTSLNARKIV